MATNATSILRLEAEKQPAVTLVHCAGKVTIESCDHFSSVVRSLIPDGKPIRVDLSKVVRVDSVGMGAFVSVWTSAKSNGCSLKFVNPSVQVRDLVEITKLYDLFEPAAVRA